MPITHSDTDLSTLRINNFDTLADYRAAYQAGYIDGNEISFIDENLQADWNQSDPNEPDYIKNKPVGISPYGGLQIVVGTAAASVTIEPNKAYVFGTVSSPMSVVFGTQQETPGYVSEYNIRFTIGSGGLVALPGVRYNGGVVPTWTTGHTYEISVVDGLAAMGEYW